MEPREVRWLKRTILIGLGGTGKEALLRVKKNFVGVFGEIPPLVKFLLIDTTAAATDEIIAETPDGSPRQVRLEPNEILFIEARGASMLPKTHDEIREWFPPKADLKTNIISGAGQIRALGRLALFANAHSVYEGLRALLSQARDYAQERPDAQQRFVYKAYSPHLTACIVGSLAGGTGAGIFLDVAMILRDILKDEDQLFGYFLLPDIYVNRPGTQNVEANAYAALCELDHFMSLDETHRYPFGGREIEVRKKPFDMVFLVNNRNRAGKTFNTIEDMAELLGLGAFLVSGPLGKQQADVFDNIVMQLTEQQGAFYGKRAHYASFGAAELRFRPQGVSMSRRYHQAAKALHEWLTGNNEVWGTSELERAMESLVEQTALPEDPPPDFRAPKASNSRAEDSQRWNEVVHAFQQLEERICAQAVEVIQKKLEVFEELLEQKLDDDSRVYRFPALKAGVERLRARAETLRRSWEHAVKEEERKQDENRAAFAANLPYRPSLREQWGLREPEQARVTRGVIGREQQNAVSRATKKARLKAAEKLVQTAQQRLEEFERLELAARQFVEALRVRAKASTGDRDRDALPFTLELPPPYLEAQRDLDEAESEVALAGENPLKKTRFRELRKNPEAILKEVFDDGSSACLKDWLREVQRKDRKDSLRMAVEFALRELNDLSAPAWDYQDAWLANPRVARREQVHILGLGEEDPEHPLLSGEFRYIFADNVDADRKLACVPTGDPNRIYLYKIEASIPAFTLQGIERYRERYADLSADRSFHVDRKFEEKPPELFPMPSREDTARVWVKARIFNLIRHDGDVFQRRAEGDAVGKHWYELGGSLGKAFRRLQQEFLAFKELEAAVAAWEKRAFRDGYREHLKQLCEEAIARCKQLKEDGAQGNGANYLAHEDVEVVDLEMQALSDWLKELENSRGPDAAYEFPTFGPAVEDGAAPDNHRR
ncbi:hypothetical protein HRbin30_01988 [bacterium HR30]|nr:hypothetical protein HRbin30_01988 [bacterium HR30]